MEEIEKILKTCSIREQLKIREVLESVLKSTETGFNVGDIREFLNEIIEKI